MIAMGVVGALVMSVGGERVRRARHARVGDGLTLKTKQFGEGVTLKTNQAPLATKPIEPREVRAPEVPSGDLAPIESIPAPESEPEVRYYVNPAGLWVASDGSAGLFEDGQRPKSWNGMVTSTGSVSEAIRGERALTAKSMETRVLRITSDKVETSLYGKQQIGFWADMAGERVFVFQQ